MKNRLFLFFVLAAFVLSLAMPLGSVIAAGKTATLVDFKHEPAKGWTAIFKITGDWKDADLKGNTITVDGKTYNLYCNFRDDTHISCTMSHDMGQLIGKPATFFLGGQTFGGIVPDKKICLSYGFYSIYEGEGGWTLWYNQVPPDTDINALLNSWGEELVSSIACITNSDSEYYTIVDFSGPEIEPEPEEGFPD